MKEIVIASNNPGKIKEFKEIFAPYKIRVIPQSELEVPEVDEPFFTFVENSLHKAKHCARYTGLPALADDSGLCVNSLQGAPGILSARYAGTPKSDAANIQKLLIDLKEGLQRDAYFYCSLVFVRHFQDPQPIIADGILYGQISEIPKGNNGHGYDPIFWLQEYQKTVAELDSSIKNRISHRAIAMHDLVNKLAKAKLL